MPKDQIRMTIYLPEELVKRLCLAAAVQEKSKSQLVAEALVAHLPRYSVTVADSHPQEDERRRRK